MHTLDVVLEDVYNHVCAILRNCIMCICMCIAYVLTRALGGEKSRCRNVPLSIQNLTDLQMAHAEALGLDLYGSKHGGFSDGTQISKYHTGGLPLPKY